MKPEFANANLRARCPDCNGALTTFEVSYKGKEFGDVIVGRTHEFNEKKYSRVIYKLMRCAGCGRGGLAKVHCNNQFAQGELESFFPISIERLNIPDKVPEDIKAEFHEAELCASYGATRAASALFRSTLEKTLKENGFTAGNLKQKIDEAAKDGIITKSRQQRVHNNIRILGNDVLHEDWREIRPDEVNDSHRYAQRILEDFYDDRKLVESILIQKKRISVSP
ncbi:MAG: DUF4145 domain-containing protein [Candidatus Heimdallarchaeaceae archaeon]